MNLETWHLVVALAALLGPGLVYLGTTTGRLMERTEQHGKAIVDAHGRIDSMEKVLREEMHRLGDRLEKSLGEAWRHCPMASDHKE